jgi:hypothetical protein
MWEIEQQIDAYLERYPGRKLSMAYIDWLSAQNKVDRKVVLDASRRIRYLRAGQARKHAGIS